MDQGQNPLVSIYASELFWKMLSKIGGPPPMARALIKGVPAHTCAGTPSIYLLVI